MSEPMSESTRKAIFHEVVSAEDDGARPSEARRQVAERFGITPDQVREIEDEGIKKTWPPLEECDEEGEDA